MMEGLTLRIPRRRRSTRPASQHIFAISTFAMMAMCAFATFGPWAPAGASMPQNMWDDTEHFSGNCTQRPVHHLFYVNASAVSIKININFTANGSFPGASVVLYGPDGFVTFADNADVMSYHTSITNISKNGRWKLSMSVNFCSLTNPIEYDMNLIIRNHVLEPPTARSASVRTGGSMDIQVSNLELGEDEMCRLDLGDGQVTPWFHASGYTASYSKTDKYELRAQVRTRDGTVTGWSEPFHLTVVDNNATGIHFSPNGSAIAFILIGMLGLVAYSMSKQR